MSMLAGLATQEDIVQETDSLGGGSRILESGLYKSKIQVAYLEKSKGGALGLVLHLETDSGQDLRQTLWVASGDAKGNKTYYVNAKNEKHFLPGYLHANSICLLTCDKEISQMATEEKVIKLYNFDAKAEVPTKVNMLVDLIGKEIAAGVIKQTVDKNVKNADGKYVPSGEVREENEIDKIFRATDGMTVAEIRANATEAVFATSWKDKWTGVTKDRTTKQAAGSTAGAPTPQGAAAKPTTSLFG